MVTAEQGGPLNFHLNFLGDATVKNVTMIWGSRGDTTGKEQVSLCSWNCRVIASGKGGCSSLHLLTRKPSWRKFREEEPTVAICLEELLDEKKYKELTA